MPTSNGLNNNQNFVNQDLEKQEKAKDREIEAKMKNYVSTEGITTKQLEIGLWYVEHKKHFRMIFIIFLIIVGAVSWAYTIYGFAYYIAKGMTEDEILTKQLVQINSAGHDYIKQISAKDLVVSSVQIIKSADKK